MSKVTKIMPKSTHATTCFLTRILLVGGLIVSQLSLVPLTAKAATPKPNSLIGQAVDPEPTAAPSPTVAPDSTETPTPKADPAPPAPPDSLDSLSIEALDAKVLEIGQQFGKLDPRTHLATFDAKAAKDAGYDSDIIRLVKEQVDFQNELVGALKSGKTRMGDFKPSAEKYPKLKRFHDRAAEKAKKPKSKTSLGKTVKVAGVFSGTNLFAVNTATACGTYDFPKPNVSPTRYYYNQTNPPARDWLLRNGFHETSDYATGNYRNNYTRPTFYSGVQGTCDSPKFRDDGTVTGTTTMNIQYKEPNPEVFDSYYGGWPYLGWADYVNWWHSRY